MIAVMSSNVDHLLYGFLAEGAEVTNSVLQQFLVGNEEHGTFRFCGKKCRQDEDFGFMSRLQTTLSDYKQSLSTRNMA